MADIKWIFNEGRTVVLDSQAMKKNEVYKISEERAQVLTQRLLQFAEMRIRLKVGEPLKFAYEICENIEEFMYCIEFAGNLEGRNQFIAMVSNIDPPMAALLKLSLSDFVNGKNNPKLQ